VEILDTRIGKLFHLDSPSRLSKRAFMDVFMTLTSNENVGYDFAELSYGQIKHFIVQHFRPLPWINLIEFKSFLKREGFGPWISKPSDVVRFKHWPENKIHHQRFQDCLEGKTHIPNLNQLNVNSSMPGSYGAFSGTKDFEMAFGTKSFVESSINESSKIVDYPILCHQTASSLAPGGYYVDSPTTCDIGVSSLQYATSLIQNDSIATDINDRNLNHDIVDECNSSPGSDGSNFGLFKSDSALNLSMFTPINPKVPITNMFDSSKVGCNILQTENSDSSADFDLVNFSSEQEASPENNLYSNYLNHMQQGVFGHLLTKIPIVKKRNILTEAPKEITPPAFDGDWGGGYDEEAKEETLKSDESMLLILNSSILGSSEDSSGFEKSTHSYDVAEPEHTSDLELITEQNLNVSLTQFPNVTSSNDNKACHTTSSPDLVDSISESVFSRVEDFPNIGSSCSAKSSDVSTDLIDLSTDIHVLPPNVSESKLDSEFSMSMTEESFNFTASIVPVELLASQGSSYFNANNFVDDGEACPLYQGLLNNGISPKNKTIRVQKDHSFSDSHLPNNPYDNFDLGGGYSLCDY